MDKIYTGRYPERGQEQHKCINKALISMLNCRRYLAGQDFEEILDNEDLITNLGGKVIFPDGSEVNKKAFTKTDKISERNSLLERMIKKDIIFKRAGFWEESPEYLRDNVIRTTFGGKGYNFSLSVIDTTKEGIIFPVSLFMYSPKKFSFKYDILLNKNIVTDKDIEEFEKYKKELEDSSKQENLLEYAPQTVQKKSTKTKIPHQEIKTNFINPWEIEVPKIGGKKNE